jgi:hypothetical protein
LHIYVLYIINYIYICITTRSSKHTRYIRMLTCADVF